MIKIQLRSNCHRVVFVNKGDVFTTSKASDDNDKFPYGIRDANGPAASRFYWYAGRTERDKDFVLLTKAAKGGGKLLTDIRQYISDNRDMIYTVLFVALLDQFFFEGAFRERLKKLIEGVLSKAENKTRQENEVIARI